MAAAASPLRVVNSHPLALGDDDGLDETLELALPANTLLNEQSPSPESKRSRSTSSRIVIPAWETITDTERRHIDLLKSSIDSARANDSKAPATNYDDYDLARFLRGNEMDVDAALAHILAAEELSAQCRAGDIRISHVEHELRKGYAYFQEGTYDSAGRTILVFEFGKFDPKASDRVDVLRLGLYLIERALENACHAQQIACIMSYKGWKLRQSDRELTRALAHILSTIYAERIGSAHLVNTPGYFKVFWKICKPWIPKRTARRIAFVNQERLRTDTKFGAAAIPTTLGGTCKFDLEAWIKRRYVAEGLNAKSPPPKHSFDDNILQQLRYKERTAEDDMLDRDE